MKSQELQIDVLKRQNREMAIKMQNYRVENQELKAKNGELNEWVGNLSEVFSILSASWQSTTALEETLLNLMKRKTDAKDRTLLRKYQFYFKTFTDIINNLSDKIKNPGHSEQATQEAKEQLRSFFKNYELIFKELLETYFKFNQQYTQFLTDLKNREDVKEQVRVVVTKGLESTQKNKQFEAYIESLKEKFQAFEEFNSNKLLEGVVKKKEEEIQALRERNSILERRIKVMFDYNNASIEFQIASQENQNECVCGGVQLAYFKKAWEEKMKSSGQNGQQKHNDESKGGPKSESVQILEQKLSLIEEQKQNLITRNTLLLEKISKMSTQYKLTDQMVLKSNVYLILKEQCQYLMDYVTELLAKLKKQQDFMGLIEKAREEELRELRKRYQKSKAFDEKVTSSTNSNFNHPVDIFKTEITTLIRQLINSFQQLSKKHVKSEDSLKQFKKTFDELKKGNEEMNKKINDLQARELSKTDGPEFKYQKYKQIQTCVQNLLQKDMPNLLELWKQFIVHVKGRDKKIKDLESVLRKKEKELVQKTQIESVMQTNINETEKIYFENKQKLSKTEAFMKKTQVELLRLAEENSKLLYQSEQDKSLLTLRLKAQTEARNKLEEKISILGKIEAHFTEVKDNDARIQKDYEIWLQSHKKVLQQCKRDCKQKQLLIKNQTEEISQTEKTLQKVQNEKQTLKSQIRQLTTRLQTINSSAETELLKMELEQYKGKLMCNCTGNREREVVLKTCPHLFCKRCIENTTNNRNRNCPLCGIRFTKTDVHEIKWN